MAQTTLDKYFLGDKPADKKPQQPAPQQHVGYSITPEALRLLGETDIKCIMSDPKGFALDEDKIVTSDKFIRYTPEYKKQVEYYTHDYYNHYKHEETVDRKAHKTFTIAYTGDLTKDQIKAFCAVRPLTKQYYVITVRAYKSGYYSYSDKKKSAYLRYSKNVRDKIMSNYDEKISKLEAQTL